MGSNILSIFEHSKSQFANAIIGARKNAGLTAKEVAEKLGKSSHSSISMWENDKGLPQLDDFVALCKLYGVTPNEILCFGST